VSIEFRSHVHVARLDCVEDQLSDSLTFDVDEVRLEQSLRGLETFASEFDDAAVGKSVLKKYI
jgi:hypothetical protein